MAILHAMKRNRSVVGAGDAYTAGSKVRFLVFYNNSSDEMSQIYRDARENFSDMPDMRFLHSELSDVLGIDREEKFQPDYRSAQTLSVFQDKGVPVLERFIQKYRSVLIEKGIRHDEIRYEFTKKTLEAFDAAINRQTNE
ncbi:MAG: hypothetical protein NTU57_01380 [Candidatus Aenigmarchaeota archaeon]|nr:hypothetical protein [Candidatus Aenigmarchaeota archaeon]